MQNTPKIAYQFEAMAKFYSTNRNTWNDFYPSEKLMIKRVMERVNTPKVLDMGGATGGLGHALTEKWKLAEYVCLDINEASISEGRSKASLIQCPSRFIVGDATDLESTDSFDIVYSLSCADWDIKPYNILRSCWKQVEKGGYLLFSARLTDQKTVTDINQSFQYCTHVDSDLGKSQIANYVIFNYIDLINFFCNLDTESIEAYGDWGLTPPSANTVYEKVVFSVFLIRKDQKNSKTRFTDIKLDLPEPMKSQYN